MDFAGRLYELLKINGWKKQTLAGVMGISPSTLTGYLSGKNSPNISDFCDYANRLGVSLEWLSGSEMANLTNIIKPGVTTYSDIIGILNQLLDTAEIGLSYYLKEGVERPITIPNKLVLEFDNEVLYNYYSTSARMRGLVEENRITEDDYTTFMEGQMLKYSHKTIGSDSHAD